MNMNEMLGNEGEAPSVATSLRAIVEATNIADTLDEEKLTQIGSDCAKGFEYDLSTRSEWEQNLKDWTKLALQVREEKSWPWPKAANVKYPLLSTAAMQFNARAYPSLTPKRLNPLILFAFRFSPSAFEAFPPFLTPKRPIPLFFPLFELRFPNFPHPNPPASSNSPSPP